MTSSAGPGFSLKQEGISYMASYGVPAVIVNVMRYGVGCGDITQGQDSYLQAVKGGGNGDYRMIVLSPATVGECASFAFEAFDLAEKYRNPVLVLSDGAVGQMVEPCTLPEPKEHDIDKYEWYIKGRPQGEEMYKATNLNWYWGDEEWERWTCDKYANIMEHEQRWEAHYMQDAEIVLVAFGVSARVCKKAAALGRERGMKIGFIRPVTLWPYPREAFRGLPDSVKCYLSVQMDITGQMVEDIYLADRFLHPVYSLSTAIRIPTVGDILDAVEGIRSGKAVPKEPL